MKTNSVYILGTGGMAREAYQIFCRRNESALVKGFVVESAYEAPKQLLGLPVITFTSANAAEILSSPLLPAIGSPAKRNWIQTLKNEGASFYTLIHPAIELNDTIHIGEGSIVVQGTQFTRDIEIGNHVIVNVGASMNHDVTVGDYTHIAPGVAIAGNVQIGMGCWIGIGAAIIHNITIGNNSFIAAGAVVIDNVADESLYAGVPTRLVRKISENEWNNLI